MEILPLRLMPTRALPDPRAGTRLILAKNSMRGHGDGMPAGRPARWLLEESRPAPSSARPIELQEALLTSYKFLAGLPVKPQSELDESEKSYFTRSMCAPTAESFSSMRSYPRSM